MANRFMSEELRQRSLSRETSPNSSRTTAVVTSAALLSVRSRPANAATAAIYDPSCGTCSLAAS
eukprot:12105700-Alexandrium_andersonii.AAC.1